MTRRRYRASLCLQRPAWGPHVSIMRGEEPPAGKAAFDEMSDLEVSFRYAHDVEGDGKHFWLPVFCDPVLDIRERLGLSRQPMFPLHLTFAVAEG